MAVRQKSEKWRETFLLEEYFNSGPPIIILTSLFLIIFLMQFVWLIGCLGVVLSDVP